MSTSPLHKSSSHESAVQHVTGVARYVDDLPEPRNMLVGLPIYSPHARAKIVRRDGTIARMLPGIHAVLFAADVPGDNLIGPIFHDETLFAEDEALCVGHTVALIVGESLAQCRAAAKSLDIGYEVLEPVLTIADAIAAEQFHTQPHRIARGDVDSAIEAASEVVRGTASSGGQDHFYLETQAALALPGEQGEMHVYSSTQHPTEIQKMVALVLGLNASDVVCEVPRMGGGFGGKESQATHWAAFAALGAQVTGRPCKVWLDRDRDMVQTGNRHPFWTRYEAAFDDSGRITALRAHIYSDGGFSIDLSGAVLDRAVFHLDNAYYLPVCELVGQVCKTNLPSNTAFRGFGGPQGMVVVEDAINRYAERTGQDPAVIRARNHYGDAPRNTAPYGQEITQPRVDRIWQELSASSDYEQRRSEIDAFNATSRWVKRGIAYQPVKFGISFTASVLNQAGALILIYTDGTIQLNHGGTEMGQGLHSKMLAICAHAFGVSTARIRAMNTRTDKIPNTSATAASSGSDLNGQAVQNACDQLLARMRPVAAELLGVDEDAVTFAGDAVHGGGASVAFPELANACWVRQISLHSAGFYRTPGIHYDHATGSGEPFFYYAYGASVLEVEVNGLTGEHRLQRADILHDAGKSLIPSIDIGQVEGAFIQGYGWLTMEEVIYSDTGVLKTPGASTYKVPAMGDVPLQMNVSLLERADQFSTIHGSKAVGEPPFMLALGVVTALRHAIGSFSANGGEVELAIPATPEAILRAVVHATTA
jgi:xanthine dehydrogenase large subunit